MKKSKAKYERKEKKQMKTKKFKLVSIAIALMIVLNLSMGLWAFDVFTLTVPVENEHIGCCSDDVEELEPEMTMKSGHTHNSTCYISGWFNVVCKPPIYGESIKCSAGYEYCSGSYHIYQEWQTVKVCIYS